LCARQKDRQIGRGQREERDRQPGRRAGERGWTKRHKLVECKIGRQKDGGTKRQGDKKTGAETADRRRAERKTG
jgi:hypothetical protein